MSSIKVCPLCGGPAECHELCSTVWVVQCQECGCETTDNSRAKVQAHWNTRFTGVQYPVRDEAVLVSNTEFVADPLPNQLEQAEFYVRLKNALVEIRQLDLNEPVLTARRIARNALTTLEKDQDA